MIVDTTCTVTHTTVADASAWYSVPFQYETVLSVPQITVTLSDDELTYMEDYIVGASGVKLTTAPAANMKLVVSRSTPLEQTVDFQTGMVDPDEIEHSFDLAVMRDQELSSRIDVVEELPEDHEERITAIEEVIPAEANVNNKLTDKDYVDTLVSNHTNRTDNPHGVTAAQVGLGNCDNTSDLDKPVSTATQTALDGKVDKNAAITGATHTKITYDSKGLVTGGADITLSDVTDITATATEVNTLDGITASTAELNIMDGVTATTTEINYLGGVTSAVQTQLDGKVDENTAITGATKCKITYDAKGLVTAGADIDTSDLTDVAISSAQDGEFLRYDGVAGKWKNATSTASVGFSGITGSPYDNAALGKELNIKTNCITEIPQDINIQSPSNNLVLKSGSKVYVPNGVGVYTPITMSADVSRSDFSVFGSGTYLVFYSQSYGGLIAVGINYCVSGATDPSTDSSHVWFDTTENKIKIYESGSYTQTDLSLPICIMTNTYGTGVVSIDQVFNGFGYIGSTAFVLPGVKGLAPNGRNADGTLNNTEFTLTDVLATTVSAYTTPCIFMIGSTTIDYQSSYFEQEENPNKTYSIWYKPSENKIYMSVSTTDMVEKAECVAFFAQRTLGVISDFSPRQVFRATDYRDLTTMLDLLYPIGAIYIGTQDDCPLKILIPGSKWVTIQGRYLLTSGTLAGTSETYYATNYVASGLPNITSSSSGVVDGMAGNNSWSNGAMTYTKINTHSQGGGNAIGMGNLSFNATNSNSVYGQSAAVRSPAYVVNVWRRTA